MKQHLFDSPKEGQMRKYLKLIGIVLLSLLTIPAFAQDIGPALDPGMVTVTMGSNALEQSENRRAMGQEIFRTLKTPKLSAKADASAASLIFRSSLETRKKNMAQFVKKMRAVDPEGAAKLQQYVGSNDVIVAIGKGMAGYGLRTNNVADAYTLWWINAWLGATKQDFDITPAQFNKVKQQAAASFLAVPSFSTATDAVKQEMAEAFLLQGALVGAAIEDPRMQSADGKKNLSAAMLTAGKAMNIDLLAMTLTADGFVPAKGR
jgi:hypothetical protein